MLKSRGYAKSNKNMAMRLKALQTILLPWQLNNHKHIDSISELVRCHTIVVTFNFMHNAC